MNLTLFAGSLNLSSWSLRPFLALTAADLPFTLEVLRFDAPDFKRRALAISPTGKVPVLRADDLVIWDSLAICEFVAELAPAAALWPHDRATRARARAVSAEMHSGFAALRRDLPMDLCRRHPGVGQTAEALADLDRVMSLWRELRASAAGGPFLFGPFTIADAMFAPVTTRVVTYGVPLDAVCQAYVDAVAALPGMQRWRAGAEAEIAS